jgi:hypothetical protein
MASDRIVSIAKDQEGSRFIQQRLECADQDEIQLVFDEAIAAIEGNMELWFSIYNCFVCTSQRHCLIYNAIVRYYTTEQTYGMTSTAILSYRSFLSSVQMT